MLLCYSLLTLLLAGGVAPGPAQTEPTSPAQTRAANRLARREARFIEAPYKESHLDASREHLRRGADEPLPTGPTDKLRFRRDGTPRVKTAGWPRHGTKNEPK